MKRSRTVEEYIQSAGPWTEDLNRLRVILTGTGMEETVKWGAPVYTFENQNIVGLGAFKSYVAIWFFQGVFLKDEQRVLINAQKGKTKALRQWRFRSGDEIDEGLIQKYVKEAIENARLGKKTTPEAGKAIAIPFDLKNAFEEDKLLRDSFLQLSPYKQREYVEYISEAKREVTRRNRLEKSIPLILAHKGLHDKYRK